MTRTPRILQSASTDVVPSVEATSVESHFVVILAALHCALICVVGLIVVARCAWLRCGHVVGGASPRRQELANRGLKKKVLNSLPKFTYGGGKDSSNYGDKSKWVASSECTICLAEFTAGEEIRVLPQCSHGFHVTCIDTWLGSHSSCPSCRTLLVVAVTRCQKCGQFPAVAGGTESKTIDGGGNVGAAVNCSNSNNVNNDFFP